MEGALGIAGSLIGIVGGFGFASDTWKSRTSAAGFQEFVNRPGVLKVTEIAARADQSGDFRWPIYERHVIPIRDDADIKSITWTFGAVSSVQLTTGPSIERTRSESRWNYFGAAMLPVLGFVVPWGLLRVLSWILAGFFQEQGSHLSLASVRYDQVAELDTKQE